MRAVLALVAIPLVALAGCSSAPEPDPAAETTIVTVTSTPTVERGSYVTDKTGGRDPEQLREFHPDGSVLPAAALEELAQSVCRAQAAGVPPAEVAETMAGTGTMSQGEAMVFGMSATLEFCPDLA